MAQGINYAFGAMLFLGIGNLVFKRSGSAGISRISLFKVRRGAGLIAAIAALASFAYGPR